MQTEESYLIPIACVSPTVRIVNRVDTGAIEAGRVWESDGGRDYRVRIPLTAPMEVTERSPEEAIPGGLEIAVGESS